MPHVGFDATKSEVELFVCPLLFALLSTSPSGNLHPALSPPSTGGLLRHPALQKGRRLNADRTFVHQHRLSTYAELEDIRDLKPTDNLLNVA